MITLALADDHTLFRKSMAALLELVGDFQVVFQAANGRELITYLDLIVKGACSIICCKPCCIFFE